MATAAATVNVSAKRKPVFVKVDDLKPGTTGHTLVVKVVEANPVETAQRPNRPRAVLPRPAQPPRIAECLVGDETGTIIFTARNEQGMSRVSDICALRSPCCSKVMIDVSRDDDLKLISVFCWKFV